MICRVAYNYLETNNRIYFSLKRAFLVSAPSTIVDCAAIALIEQTHDDKTQSSVLALLDCEREQLLPKDTSGNFRDIPLKGENGESLSLGRDLTMKVFVNQIKM